MKTTINFALEKETKGALRFEEVTKPGTPDLVGTLYLRKDRVEKENDGKFPQTLKVTVEA